MRSPSGVSIALRPLTAEQIAAKLAFQELDRARQRRLRDIALLRRAREIQRPRDGQKIPDLVHFHLTVPLPAVLACLGLQLNLVGLPRRRHV